MSNQATARIYRTGEVTDYMSISTMEHGGTWRKYNGPVENAIDCIQIREALSGFHLEYRTWNEGVGKYYPYVNSEDDSADSYAGLAGKAIQRVNIVAYDDNNNKVDTGIVVMYRARVDGSWLPWVSNANAASMQSVQEKYGGMDNLDTTSGYAGISGKNMDGFQIRVFVEQPIGGNTGGTSDPSQGNFNGSEVNLTLSYMKDNESNWVGFNKSAFPGDYIDGIKIQTSSSDAFYLSYKTKPAGSDYFSAVLSTDSSQYAGLPGRHIQRLSISAYDKGGNKLDKGVVIMYRAYVDSKWLPWVSNAAPDWMENVWNTFDLPGTLDTSSGYAGVDGKDIKGVEIRAFVGNNINGSLTGLLGMEVSPASSRYLVGNQWYSFNKKVEASRIDGIEIKTDPNKSYYLSYQTQNEGKSTFYPAVTSLENDYAGYPNKAIQTVGIRVFTNDGAKVDSGVVVMLRTKTGGRWLPWVSNADPEWMRSVQRKYGLNLTLDTSSYEAGIQGQNIEGIEVRIFEETGIYAGAQTPAGKTKIIKNVPFIYQMNDWPTGCESVSTVMALNYAGNSMTVDTFINNYLDKQPYPFDPDETFGGDPTETENSFGCYAPVIKKALDKALANTEYHATQLSNMSMLSLCSQYIDNNIPVIMWATMEMREAYISRRWTYNGKVIQWIAPEHCLLLVGYTDTQYIFNDPLAHKQTYYGKAVVENAYEAFSRQAIVVQKENTSIDPTPPAYEYKQPAIPDTSGLASIFNLIDAIRQLETIYYEQYNSKDDSISSEMPLVPSTTIIAMTNFLRSQNYADTEWEITTGTIIDFGFINVVRDNYSTLWETIFPYITNPPQKVTDGQRGSIDLAHFAASLETYLTGSIIPDFWGSWGGDLATGMQETTNSLQGRPYENLIIQETSDSIIGNELSFCNYTDFCSDFDAYKIAQLISKSSNTDNIHLLSDIMQNYYGLFTNLYSDRFKWILEELKCSGDDIFDLTLTIFNTMTGKAEREILLPIKGGNPSDEVIMGCCLSFANYIYKMIHQ